MTMQDFGFSLRQDFIRANDPLAAKLEALRQRLHAEGKALLGEEAEAKRRGWKIYNVYLKGWNKT